MLTSYKTLLITGLFVFLSFLTHAQNLQGVWKGYTATDYDGWAGMDGIYIMQLQETNTGQYTGTSWFYETPTLYGELTIAGLRNNSADNWLFKETTFNQLTIPQKYSARLADLSLKWFDIDGEIVLQGNITSYSKYTGKVHSKRFIRLSKLTDTEIAQLKLPGSGKSISQALTDKKNLPTDTTQPVSTALTTSKNTPANTKRPTLTAADSDKPTIGPHTTPTDSSAVSKRRNSLQGSYQISDPAIDISLYDYGTIDHDTVTVYFNGVKVADRQELTAKSLRLQLMADPGREVQELILHANNLGDIPPNTAKMIILTSDKRYELKVSSSETENAMIRFRYTRVKGN
ncbi:hypothetical protein [Chitinophaga sp. RAB17]|uniref:hypothetical protein n=1 Tax=Chitinophaga sp. RAB17 TaxID=3233049 RepID=UPI003F91E232